MLKREDLERIVEAEKECGEITRLEDAAPALALACLEAIEEISDGDPEARSRALDFLREALAAAGVEVE